MSFHSEREPRPAADGGLSAGKSFFLRMLTIATPQILKHQRISQQYLPFFVACGEFRIIKGSLIGSLVSYYGEHGFPGSPNICW